MGLAKARPLLHAARSMSPVRGGTAGFHPAGVTATRHLQRT
jgi:hypothetical protein